MAKFTMTITGSENFLVPLLVFKGRPGRKTKQYKVLSLTTEVKINARKSC